MTRWATLTDYVTHDQERLQRVTIYPPGTPKEEHKREYKGISYDRLLLLTEKRQETPNYILYRQTAVRKGERKFGTTLRQR